MTRHYCCYFDHRYAPKALAMIRSLRRFETDSPIWALYLDEACREIMCAAQERGVRLVSLAELEAHDAELLAARGNRSLIEYYFTCTPSLIRFVLQRCDPGDTVTYVDGDLYFFSSPQCLHEELGDNSVSLIPHRFPESQRQREVYGLYNVGWLTFRNDANGLEAVSWWRDRCNEWCYDRLENDRFADQKYLDRFPQMFPGVVIIRNQGANVAPWNLARYRLEDHEGTVRVLGDTALVFFHFHGIKRATRWCYTVGLRPYGASLDRVTRRSVYRPYLAYVAAIERTLKRPREDAAPLLRGGKQSRPGSWRDTLRSVARSAVAAMRRDALIVIAGHII